MGQGQGKPKDGGGSSGGSGAKVIKSKTLKHKATGDLSHSRENLEEEPKDVQGNFSHALKLKHNDVAVGGANLDTN